MNVHSLDRPILQPRHFATIAEFAGWAERQERKYELVEGVPVLQPYVKRGHSLIVSNVAHALQVRLDRARFHVHQGDFAVPTGPNSVRYADVLVEPASDAMDERTAASAGVLFEVLSESTMHIDFGAKRIEYLGLASLMAYIVLAQDQRHAWCWFRQDDGEWPSEPEMFVEGEVPLASLGISIEFDEIYFGIVKA